MTIKDKLAEACNLLRQIIEDRPHEPTCELWCGRDECDCSKAALISYISEFLNTANTE